jgi:predicted nuclease with TOPRIM domain
MDALAVPEGLRKRLGDDASGELALMIQSAGAAWREGLLTEERFERFEEATGARFERLGSRFDGLESRFDGLESRFGGLESRFENLEARFGRMETRFDRVEERIGQSEQLLSERLERRLAETRAELLKWSFLFWIGQLAAISGMLAFALRSIGR